MSRMSRSWWMKFLLLIGSIILGLVYIYPTVANLDLEHTKFPFKQKVNLGLDLQGGLYMVLGVDFNKVYKDVLDRQISSLQMRLDDKGMALTSPPRAIVDGLPADDSHYVINFNPSQHDDIYALIKKEYFSLRLVGEKPGQFELGLARDYMSDVRDKTINQSIEVIRNRIDEFGVTEPSITSQGSDRVVVELPGVKDIARAKALIGKTAKLEFKMVDDKAMNPGQVAGLVNQIEHEHNLSFHEKTDQKFSDFVEQINKYAKAKIPADDIIAFEKREPQMGSNQVGTVYIPYLLKARAGITGEDLSDASVTMDQEKNQPEVAFSLNPHGATVFGKLTGENIGHEMAIVLDNIVYSAPVIQSKIDGGNGVITLGRGNQDDMMKEAKDLAIVLRAGALPAQLDFLEQRVVGPSLGQDSIKKGAIASIIGAVAVFLFVGIYYRVSGLIAVFSLILNIIFVLACLVGLDATLTLPGIAGIALTVGIAVDSNVVIYERIREELLLGKRPSSAIEAGFQKAFRTIMDANVTNAVAAIVLLFYGTGPIKGFAVTLLIGIVTTIYTAIFVCKVIFDYYQVRLEEKGAKTVSI